MSQSHALSPLHHCSRWLYSAVLYPLVPLVLLYLLWRARKQPEYAKHWRERFAFYGVRPTLQGKRRVWVHAVSLGETRAAAPLIEALYADQADVHVILTHTTPTGRAAGQALFAQALSSGQMTQVYVPYDLCDAVWRFFRHFKPTDVWLMETEVWPNMVALAQRYNVPISIVNGRLSEKSMRQALKWPYLMRQAYAGIRTVCAQGEIDAGRYRQLGVTATQLVITGNVKFDMKVPPEQVSEGTRLKSLLGDRPVVLLASSREGEEAEWLLHLNMADFPEQTQWWVVPRHPQRFDDVEKLLQRMGFSEERLVRKSSLDVLPDDASRRQRLHVAQVVLGDCMGQMHVFYSLADVVLMGGAWLPYGGQNFLEPLALGRPTLMGTHTHHFAQVASDAQAAGALLVCANMSEGLKMAAQVFKDSALRLHCQQQAAQFGLRHQGAVPRTLMALTRAW